MAGDKNPEVLTIENQYAVITYNKLQNDFNIINANDLDVLIERYKYFDEDYFLYEYLKESIYFIKFTSSNFHKEVKDTEIMAQSNIDDIKKRIESKKLMTDVKIDHE